MFQTKSKKFKGMCIIAAATIALASCGTGKKNSAELSDEVKYSAEYPINTDKTLTYWVDNPANSDYKSFRDQPFYIELMKKTGVDLDMSFAPAGQGGEIFNLMVASDELPDIVGYNWLGVTGGPEKYLSEGYIMPLNDVIDKYAPNLKKYLQEHPEIDKMVKTDEGTYYAFPFVRNSDYLTTYLGPVVRKDLLDKYSLEEPQTIDEWENVLRVFKKNGVDAPFNPGTGMWLAFGAFDAWTDFYVRDGKVSYGPIEDNYKKALETYSRWYADGLMEKDIASIDNTILSAKMSTGDSAVAFASGGQMGQWMSAGLSQNPEYELKALNYPSLEKGKKSNFGYKENLYGGYGVAISTNCKDVELAARFLDYAYGDEGHMLYNFGVEGVSYTLENGEPVFTKEMYEYKSGDLGAGIGRYIGSMGSGPCIQDYRMYQQRMESDAQKQAIETWGNTNMSEHMMPPITMNSEETSQISEIMTAVKTYVEEMQYKYLLGQESLDNFDSYVSKIKDMGIDKAIEIYQAAYERYEKR